MACKTNQKTKHRSAELFFNKHTGFTAPIIRVYKADRYLELYDSETLTGRFGIGLGSEPIGRKKRGGDGRTPEGNYYVCTRNEKSRFYLSLGISYPNQDDAKRAFVENRITDFEYKEIIRLIHQGQRPPWDTGLGGEIMIHGGGNQGDWTAGCIAVNNKTMDILWNHCPIGTQVIIYP